MEQEPGKFSSFIRNIETRISKLCTLEIKTVVGDYNYAQDGAVTPKKDGEFKVINSKINLIEGDITTHISNDLIQDKYAWLRDFHARKEERGHMIVDGNIKAIISLFDLYKQTKSVNFREENMDETENEVG